MTRPNLASASTRLPPPPAAVPAHMALFLDLDGTLLEFAARPDAVHVPGTLRALLAGLHQRLCGALAILSGRSLDEIDRLLGLPDLPAAGIHGAQWRDGQGQASMLADVPADLLARAAQRIAALPGVLLEDKGPSLALHYRQNPAAAAAVESIAAELAHAAGDRFELQHGDCVIEIKPRLTDKGTALASFMALPRFRGRRPWMLGDDYTDEHAFTQVNACAGISVLIGNRQPTQAHFALPDPAAARAWLGELANDDGGKRS